MKARLINILLADGTPNGVKIIDIPAKNIKAYFLPRKLLADAKSYDDLNHAALYILFSIDGAEAYIGETKDLLRRIKSHDLEKEFWEFAVAFVSKDDSLDRADTKYLESRSYDLAVSAARSKLHNSSKPNQETVGASKASVLEDLFEDVQIIVTMLGYPLFSEVDVVSADKTQYWYCNRRKTQAVAIDTENGFTILKGSIIDATEQPSFIKSYVFALNERRELLKANAKLLQSGEVYELIKDITFKSANKAGGFVVGANVNAWTNWKNTDGKTMDEVLRQKLST